MSTLYEYYNSGDDAYWAIISNQWRGQTFTVGTVGPNEDFNITSVKLKLYRYGLPGTITVSIRAADGSGLPTGDDLSIGTIDGDTFTTNTTGEWYEITMSSYELHASTKYAIIVRALNSDSSNFARWRSDSSPTYNGGTYLGSSDGGSSWSSNSNYDFMFEVYGTSSSELSGNLMVFGGGRLKIYGTRFMKISLE